MRNDSLPLIDPGGLGIFTLMATAMTPPPFRPDFGARWDRPAPAAAAAARVATPEQAAESPPTSASAPPRRRGMMERLERSFWAQQQRDIEAYLAQSADIHDLEERMRRLERGHWHRYR